METVAVSTVTPVYRGAKTLPALVHALAEQRDAWERDDLPIRLTESIFVDDGSIDGSAEILAQLAEEYHWVHPITLARNFGQHPATIAGALHASGDWIVTLDEDLQHQPKDIVRLLYAALTEHADVVYARPHGQVHQKKW